MFREFQVVGDEAAGVTARRNAFIAVGNALAVAVGKSRFAAKSPAEAASCGDDAASGGRFGCDVADGVGAVARANGVFPPFVPTVAAAGGECAAHDDAVWRGRWTDGEKEGVCHGRDEIASIDKYLYISILCLY